MTTKPILTAEAMSSTTLILADGLTFDEFCQASPLYGALLRSRRAEIRIPLADQHYLATHPDILYFMLVVSEDDPETVAVAPVMQCIVDACPRFTLYLMRDEDDLTALNAAVDEIDLDDDLSELDVPLLLIFDEAGEYQAHWGPRPAAADAQLDAWLEQHPEYESLSDDEEDDAHEQYLQVLDLLTHEMRVWYNSGLNRACISEIRALLHELQSDDEDGSEDEDDNDEEE